MLLLLKLLLVPVLVAAVTLASRRWGLRVAGVLTGLPLVAGPTLCFFAIEQGHPFAADAARSAILGIIGTTAFCVAYAQAARHLGWVASTLVGWMIFGLTAAIVYRVPDLGGIGEVALAFAGLVAGHRALAGPVTTQAAAAAPPGDLALRMASAAGAVILFTALADVVGPRVSGVLSVFPIVTLILAVFTHVQRGADSVGVFLRGLLRGLYGLALFCLVFSIALGRLRWSLLLALTVALATQMAVQATMLWQISRRRALGAP